MTHPVSGYLFPNSAQEQFEYDEMCVIFSLKCNRRVEETLQELESYFIDEGGWCLRPDGNIDSFEVRLRSDSGEHDHLTQDQLAEWFGFEPEDVIDSYIDIV